MKKLLVSACLLGCRCRYDGKSCANEIVIALKDRYELIPVCPEQLGGLPTPRNPSERKDGGVFMNDTLLLVTMSLILVFLHLEVILQLLSSRLSVQTFLLLTATHL